MDTRSCVCTGECAVNFEELYRSVVCDTQSIYKFLINHGAIKASYDCPKCGSTLNINKNGEYRCDKVITIGGEKTCCRVLSSGLKGTFFENARIPFKKIIELSYHFIVNRLTQDEIASSTKITLVTVSDWISFCREVVLDYIESTSEQLGGPGKTVEIDEAKFGKRKFNQGRRIEGTWVFGGIERETKKIFMVPVPDRTKETLIYQIKKWILPGTTIVSDGWAAYQNLKEEGYAHEVVNHSQHFVDPETGAYTQNIERQWRDARSQVPKYGRREKYFAKYLAIYFFCRKYPRFEDRFHTFWEAVSQLYPPKETL